MHILIIPSERFVTPEEPLGGIFQRDQARILRKAGLKVGIIAPSPRSLRWLRVRLRGWPRGIEIAEDEGIPVYRCQSWRWIPGRVPYFTWWQFLHLGKKLFSLYVRDHGMPDFWWPIFRNLLPYRDSRAMLGNLPLSFMVFSGIFVTIQ